MASETGGGSSLGTGASSNSNNNNNMTGSALSRFHMFWNSQTALSITLVLGTFFLVVNIILFAAIYRRHRCGRRRDSASSQRQDDKDSVPRMADGRMESRVTTESMESMTDLRQLVSGHCQQHPHHTDVSPIQHQPIFAGSAVTDLASRAVEMTDARLPSPPPFLLRAPPPHHQFLIDEGNRSATLPNNRRPVIVNPALPANHQANAKSTREITV